MTDLKTTDEADTDPLNWKTVNQFNREKKLN